MRTPVTKSYVAPLLQENQTLLVFWCLPDSHILAEEGTVKPDKWTGSHQEHRVSLHMGTAEYLQPPEEEVRKLHHPVNMSVKCPTNMKRTIEPDRWYRAEGSILVACIWSLASYDTLSFS